MQVHKEGLSTQMSVESNEKCKMKISKLTLQFSFYISNSFGLDRVGWVKRSELITPFLLGMITLHLTLYIKMGMIGRKYNNAE